MYLVSTTASLLRSHGGGELPRWSPTPRHCCSLFQPAGPSGRGLPRSGLLAGSSTLATGSAKDSRMKCRGPFQSCFYQLSYFTYSSYLMYFVFYLTYYLLSLFHFKNNYLKYYLPFLPSTLSANAVYHFFKLSSNFQPYLTYILFFLPLLGTFNHGHFSLNFFS